MDNLHYVQKFLKEDFDLSEIESNLYLYLLKKGETTVLDIARNTGIKRATVHLNIENLIQKGLVTQTKNGRGSRRFIVAEPPERLHNILQHKKIQLEKIEEELPKVVASIYQNVPKNNNNTHFNVKYYEGKAGVRLICDEILRANELRTYVSSTNLAKYFPDIVDFYARAIKSNKDMIIKEIYSGADAKSTMKTHIESVANKRFSVKIFPESVDLSHVDYLIYDNKVAIINSGDDLFGWVFSNKDYYETSKSLFDFIWNTIR